MAGSTPPSARSPRRSERVGVKALLCRMSLAPHQTANWLRIGTSERFLHHPPHNCASIAQSSLVRGLSLSLTCATVAAVLRERLEDVHRRIEQACRRCERSPASVTLIGVTKGIPAQVIREVVARGVADLGENRVQEARDKQIALGSRLKAEGESLEPSASSLQPVRWHLIGHLQRNKVKLAVELFDAVHSVDSAELIADLERHAAERAQGSRLKAEGKSIEPIKVFIQVNISGEMTKSGCRPEETIQLAAAVMEQPNLRLAGLMTMAPFAEAPEAARPFFRQLRELRDNVFSSLQPRASSLHLSMGMSHDFEVAIEEGADVVRVGTAIFGTRDVRQET